ncbi:MAG TPA: shikimate kinase [Candidatus Fimivicinus intestinavium]|nr:shikimate kinase [Candidatus Fimivicinus intestinavium]
MKNLVLIGMPACGKSTVGVILAKTIGAGFLDTDLLLQQREGKRLQEIIDGHGLPYFLRVEEHAIGSVDCRDTVIATGGSAVYSENAMRHLHLNGILIYLKLPYQEVEARLNNIKTRGVAMAKGESLYDLYCERMPLYEKWADITVDTAGLTAEQTVEAILKSLDAGKNESSNCIHFGRLA